MPKRKVTTLLLSAALALMAFGGVFAYSHASAHSLPPLARLSFRARKQPPTPRRKIYAVARRMELPAMLNLPPPSASLPKNFRLPSRPPTKPPSKKLSPRD